MRSEYRLRKALSREMPPTEQLLLHRNLTNSIVDSPSLLLTQDNGIVVSRLDTQTFNCYMTVQAGTVTEGVLLHIASRRLLVAVKLS